MMLIDHIATSILATNIVKNNATHLRYILLVAVISAIVPDILAMIYHPGTIEYLYHRKYTNSVILAPIYSALLSIILFLFLKMKLGFLTIYVITTSNYFLHIFLDHINEYGAPLLYPLSSTIYAMDVLHSFDPIYITISLLLIAYYLISYKRKIKPSKAILTVFSLLYISHFLIMTTLKIYNTDHYKEAINNLNGNYEYITTVPKTFWRWRGIAQNNDYYLVIIDENNISLYKKGKTKDLPIEITNDSYTDKFFEYARYPIINQENDSTSMYNAIYSRKSYNLKFETKDNRIISKSISGFDLIDK